MAERKATNKYYPPDWDPSKGSINKYVGQHPYRDRARKLDQGILIVRFELPYNILCEGCNNYITQGNRYNAEKKKIGMYYSTPIFSFRMKCHLCSNWIEIHTDPKNTEYVIVSGARRKIEEWDAKENGSIALTDEKEKEKLETNAFYKLENDITNKSKAEESVPLLTKLQNLNDRQWKDPYTSSYIIRKKFRERKKLEKQKDEEDQKFKDKHLLSIDLLPETEEDKEKAKQAFKEDINYSINRVHQRKQEIRSSSIFESNSRKRKLSNDSNKATTSHANTSNNNSNIYKNSKKSKQQAKLKSLENLKMNIIKSNQKNNQDNDNSSTNLLIPDIQKSQILPLYNDISLSYNLGIQKRSSKGDEEKDQEAQQNKEGKNHENSTPKYDSGALSLISQDYGDEND